MGESTSAASNDSLTRSLSRPIQGLPDIFIPPNALTRPVLNKQARKCEEICIQFDEDYICRICHGGNSSGNLLTPCLCKGTIALAHLHCLEIWLNESNRNDCELCHYGFRVIREPKYGILWSIFVFLRHPNEHLRELMVDLLTLIVYTPSTVTSTYMLMLLCESLSKNNRSGLFSNITGFSAIFAINFIYTSWLVITIEKYIEYWSDWYKKNCKLKVILSANKLQQNPLSLNNRDRS